MADTYPLTTPKKRGLGRSGGPVSAWAGARHGLGMGPGGLLVRYVPPRTPQRKGSADRGGAQQAKGEAGRMFSSRVAGMFRKRGLIRGNGGGMEGVTPVFSKAGGRFATLLNPLVEPEFPRVDAEFPRVDVLAVVGLSSSFLLLFNRERERERGGEGARDGIHGLGRLFHGFGKSVTGLIHGLHGASTGFSWMARRGMLFVFNGLGVAGGVFHGPRKEMPPYPLDGVVGRGWHG